jgi:tetratricopeptide (TPR) repeat protein
VIDFMIGKMEETIQVCKGYADDDWEGAIKNCFQLAEIGKLMNHYELLLITLDVFGQMLLMLNHIKRAIRIFEFLRSLTEEVNDHKVLIKTYMSLGNVLQRDKQYEKALICFKNILLLSWVHDLKNCELEAYNGIAIQNFYMGDVKKCAIYLERVISGIHEADHSTMKRVAIQSYSVGDFDRKKDMRFLLFCESKHGGTIIDYTCKHLPKILEL